jgi:hypothetical protein
MSIFLTKNYLSKSAFYGLILILIVFNTEIIDSEIYFAYSVFLIFILGFTALFRTIYENYTLNKMGSILVYIQKPTPGKSMFESLEKNGVKFSNIQELYIMTYNLRNKYYQDSEYSRLLKKNGKDYKFKLTGFGNENDKDILKKDFKNLSIKNLDRHLTEHFNLIKTTQGESYLWYEPYHKSVAKKEILPDGAYLVKIDNDKFIQLENIYYYNSIENDFRKGNNDS